MAIENINELEKFVSLEEGQTIQDLLTSEEAHTIKLKEDMIVLSQEEKETMIGNYKEDFETAGREKLLKEMRDTAGLEYEGVKDPSNFINAFAEKTKKDVLKDAQIEPDKKIESLTKDLDILRSQLTEKDNKFIQLENEYKNKESQRQLDSKILGLIPDNTVIDKDDLLTIFKTKYELENGEAGVIVKKNGEQLKDDLRNPVGLEKVINEFASSYISKATGGAGKSDDVGSFKAGSYEAFEKEMLSAGHKVGSLEFSQKMQERIKDGTLKI